MVRKQLLSCLNADKLVAASELWYGGLKIVNLNCRVACCDFNPFKVISIISFLKSTISFRKKFKHFGKFSTW